MSESIESRLIAHPHREYRFSKSFRAPFLVFGVLGAGLLVFETLKLAARPPNDPREIIAYLSLLIFIALGAVYLLSIYRLTAGYILLREEALVQVLPDGSRVMIRWEEITAIERSPFLGHTLVTAAKVNKKIRIEHQLSDYPTLMDEIDRRVPGLHADIHTFHVSSGSMIFVIVLGLSVMIIGFTGAGIYRERFPRVTRVFFFVLGVFLVWKAITSIRAISIGRYSASIQTVLGGRMLRDICGVELRVMVRLRPYGGETAKTQVVMTMRSGRTIRILNVNEGEDVLYEKLTAMLERANDLASTHPEIMTVDRSNDHAQRIPTDLTAIHVPPKDCGSS